MYFVYLAVQATGIAIFNRYCLSLSRQQSSGSLVVEEDSHDSEGDNKRKLKEKEKKGVSCLRMNDGG